MTNPSRDDQEALSFEDALGALESLVEAMEGDEMPLEEMIVGYEKGMRLHGVCEKRLEEARAKVLAIRKKAEGEGVEISEFEGDVAEATSGAEKGTAKAEGDGELF